MPLCTSEGSKAPYGAGSWTAVFLDDNLSGLKSYGRGWGLLASYPWQRPWSNPLHTEHITKFQAASGPYIAILYETATNSSPPWEDFHVQLSFIMENRHSFRYSSISVGMILPVHENPTFQGSLFHLALVLHYNITYNQAKYGDTMCVRGE